MNRREFLRGLAAAPALPVAAVVAAALPVVEAGVPVFWTGRIVTSAPLNFEPVLQDGLRRHAELLVRNVLENNALLRRLSSHNHLVPVIRAPASQRAVARSSKTKVQR